MKKSLAFVLLTIPCAYPSAMFAQRDSVLLPNVIVTATKNPADKSRLGVPVTVVTGAELRARGITRVVDALRVTPGVAIVQNGSTGSVSSIFLRGGESRYTKILVDGVPLNAPGGYIDLSNLTTDNVEKIEIVRGPSSVLYGADAVSGVIQIFTRGGGGAPRTSVAARAGSLGTREVEVNSSGQSGVASYSLGGGYHATSGIYSFNNDYRNGTASGSLLVPVPDFADIRLVTRYTTAEYHYPTDYTGMPVDTNSYHVQHRLITSLQAERNISTNLHATVSAGSNDLRDLTEDIAVPFGSKTQVNSAFRSVGFRRFADARITSQLSEHSAATVGTAYQREREYSANLSRPLGGTRKETSSFNAARTNAAFYGELQGAALRKLDYTLSARTDRNSDFGTFVTNSSGVSYRVVPETRLRASYGTAFNAPAFAQLRPTLYTKGSPNLDAERSASWQVGLEQKISSAAVVSGTLYRQRFTRMIQYVAGGPPTYLGSYSNLAEASSNGSELEAEIDPSIWTTSLSGLHFRANYSETRPRVTRLDAGYSGSLKIGDALIRRATHTGSATLSFARPLWDMDVIGNYVGRRPDLDFSQFPSPTLTLPAYSRFDAAANLSLPGVKYGEWKATIRLENLADRKYREVLGFDAPGRAAYVGFRWGSPAR